MKALRIYAYVSIITAVLILFVPMKMMWRIRKNGRVINENYTFAMAGAVKCAFWARYGHLIQENSTIVLSLIGVPLYAFYVLIFIYYTAEKFSLLMQSLVCLTLMALMMLIVESAPLQTKTILGFTCMILSVATFAAPLTVFRRIIIDKAIRDRLPILIITMNFLSNVQRLVFGILIANANANIAIPNGLGVLIAAVEFALLLIYPNRKGGRSFLAHHFKCFRPLSTTW